MSKASWTNQKLNNLKTRKLKNSKEQNNEKHIQVNVAPGYGSAVALHLLR